MGRGRKHRPRLSPDDILTELRARLRAQVSIQTTNASETETGLDQLPQQKRREVKDKIQTETGLNELPRQKRKEVKDQIQTRSRKT